MRDEVGAPSSHAHRRLPSAASVVPRRRRLRCSSRRPVSWGRLGDRFDDPDRYDIKRNVSGHAGFGMGIHQCVGQHVARLEGEIVLAALARKVDRWQITGEPKRRLNNTLRAWDSLPVTVSSAAIHKTTRDSRKSVAETS